MKKFEEAELNVMLVENSVICTSGGCQNPKWCDSAAYNGGVDGPCDVFDDMT